MHRNVHVFADHDNEWFLEFEVHCENLDDKNLCRNYEDRPKICRDHGAGDQASECEFHADGEPHKIRFSSSAEFEEWLDGRKTDWRWKNL